MPNREHPDWGAFGAEQAVRLSGCSHGSVRVRTVSIRHEVSLLDIRYNPVVIRSFRCKDTERLAAGFRVRRFIAIERVAQRKLAQLNAAATLDFLRVPPGNRLEALRGDRAGFYSIRINDQWRLCFRYENGNAYDAEIVDYH